MLQDYIWAGPCPFLLPSFRVWWYELLYAGSRKIKELCIDIRKFHRRTQTMARRSGWSRTFRKDSKLQQYFLDQVVPTRKTLGAGSYGSVLEVSGYRRPCIRVGGPDPVNSDTENGSQEDDRGKLVFLLSFS